MARHPELVVDDSSAMREQLCQARPR